MIRHVAGAAAARRHMIALVLMAAAGCGGGSSDKAAPAAPPPSAQSQSQPQSAQGAKPVADGTKQVARGGQPPAPLATPVDFETLKTLLPEVEGWKKVRATGEKISLPVPYALASARYSTDTTSIDLEIKDSALSQVLLGAETMFMTAGFDERSSDGYKKAVTIRNYPGYESWNVPAKIGGLTVIVANRFVVHGSGRDLANIEPVRAIVQAVNFQALARLK